MYHAPVGRSGHFALYRNGDLRHDVSMQDDLYRELAHGFQGTFRQTDLRFLDLETIANERSSDVHAGNRTEQTTVHARFLRDGDRFTGQLLARGLRNGQLLGLHFFDLGAAGLEFLQGGLGSATGDFLGYQVVAGIAVTHANDLTQVTQISNFFEQYDLHDDGPRISCGYRCKAAGPGSANA